MDGHHKLAVLLALTPRRRCQRCACRVARACDPVQRLLSGQHGWGFDAGVVAPLAAAVSDAVLSVNTRVG